MNPVGLRRKVVDVRRDFQKLDDIGNLLRNAGGRIRLDDLVDFGLERRFVGHASFRSEEAVFGVEQLVRSPELPAERRFIDTLSVVPGRKLVRPQALRHAHQPPFCGQRSSAQCCGWYRRQAESRRCSCASKHLHRTGSRSGRTPAAAHGHNFSKKSESVKRSIQHLKKKAQEFVAAERSAVYECDKVEGKIKNGIYDKNSSWKNSLHYDKIEKSDSNLYSVIIGRHVKGRTGTGIISFKNSVLPKEISSNFPQIKSLSESIDSYEELRKVLILLFSYCFWSEGTPEEGNDYDEYIIRLNLLLQEANMSPLYFGNPFDWLFMYCALNNHPLDAFRGILEEVCST